MGLKAVSTSPQTGQLGCSPGRSSCSHLCLTTPQGPVCACPTGEELHQDNFSCFTPQAFLIFTRRDDIKRISIETENSREMLIPVRGVSEASGVDYDRADGRIYWSDIKQKTISRAHSNGSSVEVMVEHGLDYPRGLALDWRAGNLYWTDAGTGRLEMISLTSGARRVLIWRQLDSPQALVLHTAAGRIIWSVWGQDPSIEAASLDGEGREVVVASSGRATGLTVDSAGEFLFWTDQDSDQISCTSLATPGRVKTVYSSGHPYALTYFQSTLYWTDWDMKNIYKAGLDRTDLSTPVVLKTGVDYIMDMVVYSASQADAEEVSECSELKCEHLCVVKAGLPVCLCPSHYSLQSDGLSCSPPPTFLLFSQKNKISRLVMSEDKVPDIVLPIKKARSIQSISYDQVEDMIYWVDHGRDQQPARQVIRRSSDLGDTQVLNRLDKFLPFDLAIDPTTR